MRSASAAARTYHGQNDHRVRSGSNQERRPDSTLCKTLPAVFFPTCFYTFGGIYGGVWRFHPGGADPLAHRAADGPPRIKVSGSRLELDGKPFYLRGLLHWGWYPELGHTAPPLEQIQKEIRAAKALGFNTVKFCLWVPPHRYLEALEAEGMVAWLELPVWNPAAPDESIKRLLGGELEEFVRQYRRHSNIIAWTVGCEMGKAASAAFRKRMTSLVRSLTGCPLVRDDSGGAEMYGGDPREFEYVLTTASSPLLRFALLSACDRFTVARRPHFSAGFTWREQRLRRAPRSFPAAGRSSVLGKRSARVQRTRRSMAVRPARRAS